MTTIRSYIDGDAAEICAVFEASVQAIGPEHYTEQQVQAWIAHAPTRKQVEARCADGRVTYVSLNQKRRIVGYIDLEADGHIDHLYCAPEATRKGISLALYEVVERRALEKRMARLYTEASEAAMRFFARRGFSVLNRRDLKRGGVEIHNFTMQKMLDQQ